MSSPISTISSTVPTSTPSTALYKRPRKRILTKEHLDAFQASSTYDTIVSYIESLNGSVVGVKLSDECVEGDGVRGVLTVLDHVEKMVGDTPPVVDDKGSRFGNPAFRTFYDRLAENSHSLHARIPHLPEDAIPEISVYFCESWGNRQRIDYGSGMEFNFLSWLICLDRLGVFEQNDKRKALVLRIFWRYIRVMRLLQSTYWLEPAGSHGVWGLDDYHFLPFLFGSAQLSTHKYIRPKSIHDADVVEEYAKEYMYLACIQFINSIKTTSLRWHSPMLDDISGVKTWEKVNVGMMKMYRAEVLGKLPVVQHFLFGSILPYPSSSDDSEGEDDGHGHGHEHGHGTGWGDCCGIPVPSAFGAEGRRLSGPNVRPVPFD